MPSSIVLCARCEASRPFQLKSGEWTHDPATRRLVCPGCMTREEREEEDRLVAEFWRGGIPKWHLDSLPYGAAIRRHVRRRLQEYSRTAWF